MSRIGGTFSFALEYIHETRLLPPPLFLPCSVFLNQHALFHFFIKYFMPYPSAFSVKTRPGKAGGFTVIELMVVMGVIALLSAIVISSLSTTRQKARNSQRIETIRQLQQALNLYNNSCGEYPNTLSLSANNGCALGVSLRNFLAVVPLDPRGGAPYQYAALGSSSCVDYHLGTAPRSFEATSLPSNDTNYDSSGGAICTGSNPGFDGDGAGVLDVRP